MRNLIYLVHTSIDGYVDGPAGEFDWPSMGPELSAYTVEITARVDTFLYGRKVWDMMAGYWPHADSGSASPHSLAFAPIWRKMPKIVFSRTLEKADRDAQVLNGDLTEEINTLKQLPGEALLLTGGADLAGQLTELGLIDEYLVIVHPVVLGGGRPLFAKSEDRLNLRLAESRTFDGRSVLLRYER
jgi:dihydrofolate reductase